MWILQNHGCSVPYSVPRPNSTTSSSSTSLTVIVISPENTKTKVYSHQAKAKKMSRALQCYIGFKRVIQRVSLHLTVVCSLKLSPFPQIDHKIIELKCIGKNGTWKPSRGYRVDSISVHLCYNLAPAHLSCCCEWDPPLT